MSDVKLQAYRTKRPCWRDSRYIQAGSVVRIPADEKPSKTWVKIDEAEAKASPKVTVAPEGIKQADAPKMKGAKPADSGRASDRDV